MKMTLGLVAVFSLILLMVVPVHADVTSATLDKASFSIDSKFTIQGTVDDINKVTLLASMKGPSVEKLTRTAMSDNDGKFSFLPVNADDLFNTKGIYEITIFTEYQTPENGTVVKIDYGNGIATLLPDYEVILNSIGNKQVDETVELTFTASITDSQITDEQFSLEKQPNGATINKDTGVFTWTPTDTQSGGYVFDIIVKSGVLEDRETITVTVVDKPVVTTPPPTTPPPPTTTPPPPPPPAEPLGIASFVDETKDPQSYVDRYNNEPAYKKWFDDNFSEYDSIYQAVGLEEPKVVEIASFVDETKDPQSYVDRYNNEPAYKKWFDDNFSEYDSIYQAVGLEEPKTTPPKTTPVTTQPDTKPEVVEEFGECGEGTDLVDGTCVIVSKTKGGGCLIATATYGTEMAPQVQMLREIRDNQLMSTDSGVSFMSGFNQFYYSFSPYVADMERDNPIFKEMVKIAITPLLSSLSIMSYADTDSEIVSYGIGVILMNLGMYVAAPAIIVIKTRKYIKI